MKNFQARLAAVSLLFASWACATGVPNTQDAVATSRPVSTESIHVIVLHTNDIHGQVLPRPARWLSQTPTPTTGGLPRIAAYIERMRRETQGSDTGLIVLDAGDWSQGTPEGQIGRGRDFVHALQRIDYDAMCLGNHEFDHGLDALNGLLAEIDLPVTTANVLVVESGKLLDEVVGLIVLEVAGMRVGVVGLLSPETPKITHEDARSLVRFADPAETLKGVQLLSSAKVDWWLPVTHMGHDADLKLAEESGVPLIVGGHSHRFLREGLRVGNSLVVQAGCKGTVVGRVDLWFDPQTHEVLRSEAQLVDLFDEPTEEYGDATLIAECDKLVEESATLMDEVVGQLLGELSRSHDPLHSSPAGNLVADVTRQAVGADVGLMNRGGIRVNLTAGEITRRDVFELCPFDNFVVKLDMTGDQLFEFIRRSLADVEHSGVEVSGMRVFATADRKLVDLHIAGEKYEPKRHYSVALNSFMAGGGDGYLDPEQMATMSPVEDPRLLRTLLEELFLARGQITPDTANHYEVVQ